MAGAKKPPGKGRGAGAAGRRAGIRKKSSDPARRGARGRRGPAGPRGGRPGAASQRSRGSAAFYRAAFAAVDAGRPPWTLRKPRVGRSSIDSRALAKCVIVMTEENRPCRDMASYLHSHPKLLRQVGLKHAPSKSTLNRAMRRIPPRYLRRVSSAASGTSKSRAAA